MPESFLPPLQWRVVGDRCPSDEAFIPGLLRLPAPPTEEERAAWAAEAARREAERQAEMQARVTRHTALVKHHTGSPILLALLTEHAPHLVRWGGQTVQECHGCPTSTDVNAFGETEECSQTWPCPTWVTISGQTGD